MSKFKNFSKIPKKTFLALQAFLILTITQSTLQSSQNCVTGCKWCTGAWCDTCEVGWVAWSNGSCQKCAQVGCAQCQNINECRSCKINDGYWQSAPNGGGIVTCGPCQTGCKSCANALFCTACRGLYKMQEDKTCKATVMFYIVMGIVGLVVIGLIVMCICCCMKGGCKGGSGPRRGRGFGNRGRGYNQGGFGGNRGYGHNQGVGFNQGGWQQGER